MSDERNESLRVEIYVEAAPATIFSFFTEPEKLARWMGVADRLEPREGGAMRVTMREDVVTRGIFKEVRPHSRIVFTWGFEKGGMAKVTPGSTTVQVDFVPQGRGTLVTLTHSGLSLEGARRHREGWEVYMKRLAVAAPGGDPGPLAMTNCEAKAPAS